jgi:hypothetical protein
VLLTNWSANRNKVYLEIEKGKKHAVTSSCPSVASRKFLPYVCCGILLGRSFKTRHFGDQACHGTYAVNLRDGILVLIVVGVLLWLVDRFIPMAGSIKSIMNAVVTIAVVLWLLNVFGLMHYLTNIHIGKP